MTPSTIYSKPQRVLFSKLRLGPQAAIVSAHVNIRSDSGSPELLADVKSKRTPKQNKWPRERTPSPSPAMKSNDTMRCPCDRVPSQAPTTFEAARSDRDTNSDAQTKGNICERAGLCYRSIVPAPCVQSRRLTAAMAASGNMADLPGDIVRCIAGRVAPECRPRMRAVCSICVESRGARRATAVDPPPA